MREGVELQMAEIVKASNDRVPAHLVARPGCDSAKVVQAVQALDAKVHCLEMALTTAPKLADNGQNVAKAIEATMAKVMAG